MYKPRIAEGSGVDPGSRTAAVVDDKIFGVEHVEHALIAFADLIVNQILIALQLGSVVSSYRFVEVGSAGRLKRIFRLVKHPVMDIGILQDLLVGCIGLRRYSIAYLGTDKFVRSEVALSYRPHVKNDNGAYSGKTECVAEFLVDPGPDNATYQEYNSQAPQRIAPHQFFSGFDQRIEVQPRLRIASVRCPGEVEGRRTNDNKKQTNNSTNTACDVQAAGNRCRLKFALKNSGKGHKGQQADQKCRYA